MFTFRGHTHYLLLGVQVDGDRSPRHILAGGEETLRSLVAALMRIIQRGFMRRRLQSNRATGGVNWQQGARDNSLCSSAYN
jgi:hypothetical protein